MSGVNSSESATTVTQQLNYQGKVDDYFKLITSQTKKSKKKKPAKFIH